MSRLGLAQNFGVKSHLGLVSDIEKSDSLVSVASHSKNQHPLFLGLGLVLNFHKSNFSVLVSSQKIGLVPPWTKTKPSLAVLFTGNINWLQYQTRPARAPKWLFRSRKGLYPSFVLDVIIGFVI